MNKIEEIKEFTLEATKVFRCKGVVRTLTDSEFLTWERVMNKGIDVPLMPVFDIERKRLIGTALFSLSYLGNGVTLLEADIMMQYDCPERLLAETGELTLTLSVGLGARQDQTCPIDNDGRAAPESIFILAPVFVHLPGSDLKPAEFSWDAFMR